MQQLASVDGSARPRAPRGRSAGTCPIGRHRQGQQSALAASSGPRQTRYMAARRIRSALALACAGLVLAGCGAVGGEGSAQQSEPIASARAPGADPAGAAAAPAEGYEDAHTLVERALAVRADRPAEFPVLISAASRACPDPDAARRLGEVARIAGRWSSALLGSFPKIQAVTEAQLAAIDWDALVSDCVGS
jgi:hypothetical protein